MVGGLLSGVLALLSGGMALTTGQDGFAGERGRGGSREPRLFISSFYWNSEFEQIKASMENLQSTVVAQAARIATLEGSSASSVDDIPIYSNITNLYTKVQQNRKDIDKKCPRTKCDKILKKIKKVKAVVDGIDMEVINNLVALLSDSTTGNLLAELEEQLTPLKACMADPTDSACTDTYGASTSLPASTATAVSGLVVVTSDLAVVKECLEDPTAAACTAVYSTPGSLPGTTAAIGTDLDVMKECFTDPSATACTGSYSSATSLPGVAGALQTSVTDLETCMQTPTDSGCTTGNDNGASGSLAAIMSTAVDDLDVVKECFDDPTAAACTDVYSSSSSMPGALADSCAGSTCTTLSSSVTAIEECMQTPTDSSCTSGNDNGVSDSLPDLVATLTTCLTTPTDSDCAIKDTTTSVPYLVTHLDACMDDIEATTCTDTYGATTKFISNGGTGMVAWLQQLRKPSSLQCTLDGTALTFPDTGTVVTGGRETTEGCDVAKLYEKLTWGACTSTDQPDTSDSDYHMEANGDMNEVTIMTAGNYKIDLTALISLTDNKLIRTEIYKISSSDPTAATRCEATAESCTTLLQLRAKSTFLVDAAGDFTGLSSNVGERTTNGEGIFPLCPDDRIFVIASISGNTASNEATITGDETGGIRTILTVTKTGWLEGTP